MGLVTSIGYRGNGKAYTTPTRTLFDSFTLFVNDSVVYPSDSFDFPKKKSKKKIEQKK